jgi:hypothetical protein
MNKKQFKDFWAKNYPESPPINYFFQANFQNRWLRIHSLPGSKRYANTPDEWTILLERQNTVIADLIPQNTVIQIVINYIEIDSYLFKKYDMDNIGVFVDKVAEAVFQSFSFETIWQTNKLNDLLKQVADDSVRAFIIGSECLISPYDGGMNLVYKDTATRDFYKIKYKNWLSEREDGL